MKYMILLCLFLAGCACSQPVILPDPYLEQQERNTKRQQAEYYRQQIEEYNEEITPKKDLRLE